MLFFSALAVCSDRSKDATHTIDIMQTPSTSEPMTENYLIKI